MTAKDLIEAAHRYSSALRAQHAAHDALAAADVPGVPTAERDRADEAHSEACKVLDNAEYDLQLAALLLAGWSREEAEEAL